MTFKQAGSALPAAAERQIRDAVAAVTPLPPPAHASYLCNRFCPHILFSLCTHWQEMNATASDVFYTSEASAVTLTFAGADSIGKAYTLERKVPALVHCILRFFPTLGAQFGVKSRLASKPRTQSYAGLRS